MSSTLNPCMYAHVHIYVCLYTHTHTHTCPYMHIHIHTNAYTRYVCASVHTQYSHMYTLTEIHVHACTMCSDTQNYYRTLPVILVGHPQHLLVIDPHLFYYWVIIRNHLKHILMLFEIYYSSLVVSRIITTENFA